MSDPSFATTCDLLLEKKWPFVAYKLPNEKMAHLVCQKTNEVKTIDILNIEEHHGVVIAPFECARNGMAYLIQPELTSFNNDQFEEIYNFAIGIPDSKIDPFDIGNHIISHHAYINNTEYLINLLQNKALHKVVHSRIIAQEKPTHLSLGTLLEQLSTNYPDAFNYLFHIPNEGTWIGASPESLFSIKNEQACTMALAGTRAFDPQTTHEPWEEKEIKEQFYVTQYITNIFSELGIQGYSTDKTITKRAGQVEHRLTPFKVPLETIKDKIGRIIMGLHPTPAVCGLPKGDAYHLIMRAEQHDRRFYTGFIGPWNMNEQSKLFVNLRCAEIGKNTMNLYVGGGLTSDSIAENEWNETVLKSKTLLSVIEKL